MSWSSLPSQNLHNIIKYLSYIDINNLLQVCKSWFIESDYFLKDKTILHISRISTPEEASNIKRRFECLHITDADQLSIEIIKSMRGRNVKYGDKISSAFIRYKSYEDLQSILDSIGNGLRILHLKNKAKCSSDLSFPTLGLVETLKIEWFQQNIETIAPFFSSLKVLDINAELNRVSQPLIKIFLEQNPKLEKFYCNEVWIPFDEEPIFNVSKHLKELKTDNSELSSVTFKSVLPLEKFESHCSKFSDDDLKLFRKNFKNLRELSLFEDSRSFTEKGFSEIWTFPELSILELMNFRLSNCFWRDALFKSMNHKLTSLSLISIHLNDDLMEMCTKSTPNIKHFKANMWAFTSFRSIQEMAENWKKLETFEFYTPIDMSYDEDRLKYPLNVTPVFCNLENLLLSSEFKPEILTLFRHLKAPNLKTAILEICFWSEHQKYKEAIIDFSQRYHGIEVLELRDMHAIDNQTIGDVCLYLKNLKSLTLEGTTNLSVAAVGTILNSSTSLKQIYMKDFEEMFEESETISLEAIYNPKNSKVPALNEKRIEAIEKMCKSRDPQIEYQHFGKISRLYTNGIDIILGKPEKIYYISDIEDYKDEDEEEDMDSSYSVQFDTDSDEDNDDDLNENSNEENAVVYEDSDEDENAPNPKRMRKM